MYNSDLPTRADLPSSKQLLVSTLIAALIAAALLITVVLPAEYAIDPTGVGRMLGLTEMGEIKQALSSEEKEGEKIRTTALPVTEATPPTAKDQRRVTLKPGAAAELKLVMNKGDKVQYRWSVNQGHVNFDTHGDSPTLNYYGYGKGRQQTEKTGELEAAFDGKHGWFWRNRSAVEVIVTLEVEGDFQGIKRVL